MKRREMLSASFRELAQAFPLALGASGSLGKLLQVGTALNRPQRAASFPGGTTASANKSKVSKKEEV